jgi:hypothetical protein
MKKRWRDGTHALVFHPLSLIGRLISLIPPPRFHMLRFHGVLAPHAAVRSVVVPEPNPPLQNACLVGCIDNEYWYFETRAQCVPEQVGHFRRIFKAANNCFEQDGAPMYRCTWVARSISAAVSCLG